MPLTVDRRNAGIALVELLRQVVTLAGVALLVALGAQLTPFFAIQLVVGLAILSAVPFLVGRRNLVRPRFEWPEQRTLLRTALPIAASLGQIYFRLVIVLMSLISWAEQTGYFGGSLRAMEALAALPVLVAGVAGLEAAHRGFESASPAACGGPSCSRSSCCCSSANRWARILFWSERRETAIEKCTSITKRRGRRPRTLG